MTQNEETEIVQIVKSNTQINESSVELNIIAKRKDVLNIKSSDADRRSYSVVINGSNSNGHQSLQHSDQGNKNTSTKSLTNSKASAMSSKNSVFKIYR